jgi:hypothetical protein
MPKYLIYDKAQQLYVGGVQASRRVAEEVSKEFGTSTCVETATQARGSFNNDENELFWMNHTQFGVKYKCKVCLKEHLGRSYKHGHWPRCPLAEEQSSSPPVAKPMPLRSARERVAPAQESLTDQMRRVLSWANRSGLYDAADWIHTRWSEAGGR